MRESEQRQIFKEWLNKYRALLFKIIKAYATTIDDQNDLFQDVSLQIFRSIPNFRGDSAASTWIYRIALNTAIKWSTREKKHVEGHQDIDHSASFLAIKEEPADERVAWLYDQIKQFNQVDRSLILLLLEGYSYKEMADIIGISETNIGVKIHRIKKQLVNHSKHYVDGI